MTFLNVLALRIPSPFVVSMLLLMLASTPFAQKASKMKPLAKSKSTIFGLYCGAPDLEDPWFNPVSCGETYSTTEEACHDQEDLFGGLCIWQNDRCTTGFDDETNQCDEMDDEALCVESLYGVYRQCQWYGIPPAPTVSSINDAYGTPTTQPSIVPSITPTVSPIVPAFCALPDNLNQRCNDSDNECDCFDPCLWYDPSGTGLGRDCSRSPSEEPSTSSVPTSVKSSEPSATPSLHDEPSNSIGESNGQMNSPTEPASSASTFRFQALQWILLASFWYAREAGFIILSGVLGCN